MTLKNPLGCYELSRFDGPTFEKKYENMMKEVMSVFDPPTYPNNCHHDSNGH